MAHVHFKFHLFPLVFNKHSIWIGTNGNDTDEEIYTHSCEVKEENGSINKNFPFHCLKPHTIDDGKEKKGEE